MSFFAEIAKAAHLNEMSLATGYNVLNFNGEALYIEGVKRLLRIDEESIKLEVRGAIITVGGANLRLFELSDAAIIKGGVTTMEFEKKKTGKELKNEARIK